MMNDAELQQRLKVADGDAHPIEIAAGLASRVHRRAARNVRRRRIATGVACFVAAGVSVGIALRGHGVPRVAEKDVPVPPPFTRVIGEPAGPAPIDLDVQLSACQQRIAAIERGERAGRLSARLAAVRDPLAEADERQARALLDRAAALQPSQGHAAERRDVLAAVVQLYPDTISAAVARRQIETSELEKRT